MFWNIKIQKQKYTKIIIEIVCKINLYYANVKGKSSFLTIHDYPPYKHLVFHLSP